MALTRADCGDRHAPLHILIDQFYIFTTFIYREVCVWVFASCVLCICLKDDTFVVLCDVWACRLL